MKKNLIIGFVFLVLLLEATNSLFAQTLIDKKNQEISDALALWNQACKNADLELVMSMLDSSENIMIVGSDNGEINKGKDEVRKWLGNLFGFARFSWEMNRIDIDSYGKTAWIFVDGKMIVNFHGGGQKVTPYRFSGIMVKKKGNWKWRLFNGSVPQA